MAIPCYPSFEPLILDMQSEIHSALSQTPDGISEFSFACLYLFRERYRYEVSQTADGGLILSGTTPESHSPPAETPSAAPPTAAPETAEAVPSLPPPKPGTKFFSTPCGFPGFATLDSLFKDHAYWKNIPPSVLAGSVDGAPLQQQLEARGVAVSEDRDNFDYLYLRTDLAALSGKKFHKKKNLVNAFMNAWPEHEERTLESALVPDALAILEHWRRDKTLHGKDDGGDYTSTKEALDLFDTLGMRGAIYYVAGRPAAFCLGESLARGTMFAIHFEKALEQYKGIYQYMNQAFAASLNPEYAQINREQDLGSEGLRQAKMTYRPVDFVKKYRGTLKS